MDTENTIDVRKTTIINNELLRQKVNILVLQETRLAGQGSIIRIYYAFVLLGKSVNELRYHGVGLGNLNARFGSDNDSWTHCLCSFGFGKMNSNGQCRLEFYRKQNLCVTNFFFITNLSIKCLANFLKNWHQLDFILVSRH